MLIVEDDGLTGGLANFVIFFDESRSLLDEEDGAGFGLTGILSTADITLVLTSRGLLVEEDESVGLLFEVLDF